MCGNAGFFSNGLNYEEGKETLRKMLAAIRHRGPDESGMYSRNGWFQGHVRLSILDLVLGQQPMITASGKHVISFNGEIFNFRELRSELEAEGFTFKSHSDTEVLLEGFELHGIDFIRRLNGQFAFVVFARYEQRIYLARDRFGIRPLFWQKTGSNFIYGSEIKAIFSHPKAIRAIDPVGIDQAVTFWGTVPPQTCFQGVSQVVPGEVLIVDLPTLEMRAVSYWKFGDLLNLPKPEMSYREYQDGLLEVLKKSVRRQMVSDVPVGCYLSGGIDSSVTSYLAQQEIPQTSLFSVSFEDPQFDESKYQKLLVDRLKANHHSIVIKQKDIAENFGRVVWHSESLLFRTAPVPLFLLSGLVRKQGIKVVLTGEGADESLWGYDTFKEQKVRMFWRKNPASTLRPQLLRRLFPYLKHYNDHNYEMLRMFYAEHLDYPDEILYSHSVRFANNKGLKRYFSADMKASTDYANSEQGLHKMLPGNIRDFTPLERNQIIEFMTLLQGYLLSSQGDRMAMAHSIESRFPFLDNDVVEYGFTIPGRFKMSGLKEKSILKRAFAEVLPGNIVNRSKQAYMAPDLKCFFNQDEVAQTMALLEATKIRDAGLWDERAVGKLIRKYSCSLPEQIGFRDNMAACAIISSQYLYNYFIKDFLLNRTHPPLQDLREVIDNE